MSPDMHEGPLWPPRTLLEAIIFVAMCAIGGFGLAVLGFVVTAEMTVPNCSDNPATIECGE